MDEQNDFEKQYDGVAEYFADQVYEDSDLKAFIKILKPKSKVLDLGCGIGQYTNAFFTAGMDVVGIDISREMAEEAKKRYPDINIQVGDFLENDFSENQFDVVWCTAVFHHIPYDLNDIFIDEVKRILKPDGFFYLSTMVGEQKTDRWFEMEFDTKKGLVKANTYWKDITPNNLENLLKGHQFDILEKSITDTKDTEYIICKNDKPIKKLKADKGWSLWNTIRNIFTHSSADRSTIKENLESKATHEEIFIKRFDLHIPFVGNEKEAKIAESMVRDMLTKELIRTIFLEDVKSVINNKKKRLAVYEFTPPLDPAELKNRLGESEGIIYAMYGNFNRELDMHLIREIRDVVEEVSGNSLENPIHEDTKSKTVRVVALV